MPVDDLGELAHRTLAVLGTGFRDELAHALDGLLAQSSTEFIECRLHLEACVPHVEVAHVRETRHRPVVGGNGGLDELLRIKAALARANFHAGHQSRNVPLPGTRQRLIEIVEVEDRAPIRRREEPEVRDMRVSAGLDRDARGSQRREVRRHNRRSAAVERERRLPHPRVAQRQQLRDARRSLRVDDTQRVAVLGRLPRAEGTARGVLSGCFAGSAAFGRSMLWLHVESA